VATNQEEAVEDSPPAQPLFEKLTGRAAFVIGLLLLINILNFIDRQLPFILIEAIKRDLGLSDSQIGLMSGLSFALVYSFAALPLAHLADRWSPRYLLTITLAFWSLMTTFSGLSRTFGDLIVARAGVAAGEAGCTPAAHALISRSFSSGRRALVLALFSLGVPIGSMLGLSLGGWISDFADWRTAFFIVGAPGLILALAARLILPGLPARRDSAGESARFWSGLRYLSCGPMPMPGSQSSTLPIASQGSMLCLHEGIAGKKTTSAKHDEGD